MKYSAIATICVWADLPAEMGMQWPRLILYLTPLGRDRLALGILGAGLLLTWQLSHFDITRVLARAARWNHRRILAAAFAALGLVGLSLWLFQRPTPPSFEEFMLGRQAERESPSDFLNTRPATAPVPPLPPGFQVETPRSFDPDTFMANRPRPATK